MSNQLPANPLDGFTTQARINRQPRSHTGGSFLKFNGKTGGYTIGAEELNVDGEQCLIFSPSMMHGYVRWGEKPPAKAYSSIAAPLPEKPEPVQGLDYDDRPKTFKAEDARQFQGKFIDEDLGQFVFETNSMGGVEMVDELFDAILARAEVSHYCFPLVQLDDTFYKRSTGKVYKPVFNIIEWRDQNGEAEDGPKKVEAKVDEAKQEEEETVTRRRKVRRTAA